MDNTEPSAPPTLPPGVAFDGTTYRYGDQTWNGTAWVKPPAPRSTGRTIGGVLALVVAALALLQGWSWLSGALELQADGNQFAGLLVPLALVAGVVAAAFGITGIVLLSKR